MSVVARFLSCPGCARGGGQNCTTVVLLVAVLLTGANLPSAPQPPSSSPPRRDGFCVKVPRSTWHQHRRPLCVFMLCFSLSHVFPISLSLVDVVSRVPWVFLLLLLLLLSAFVAGGRDVEDEGVRLGGRRRRVPQGHPGVREIVRPRAGDFFMTHARARLAVPPPPIVGDALHGFR